ncbi:DUF4367 domain-containing protein [Bacillus sp. FSL K6-3431]|uniref:DUF4367 domain-containing protein n=1 Tax=Bacillus sp. FSL K6-3431 TaxID=2921500 RepID=UPI0030FCA758
MQKYRKIILDDSIKEIFNQKMTESSPPLSAIEAWEKMQKTDRKPKKIYGKSMLLAAAVLLLLFSIIWSPQKGIAFGRFVHMYQMVQGSVVQLFGQIGTGVPEGGKDAPDSGASIQDSDETFQIIEGSEQLYEQISMEEAQSIADFSVKIPTYLPSGFQLDEITVKRNQNGNTEEAFIHYSKKDQGFNLTQMEVVDQFSFGNVLEQEDVVIEELLIKGQKANLVEFEDGLKQLFWVSGIYYFSIEGKLQKEELLSIAKSI